jgi:CubicO group peptidase (beta-lactamase class C family)
MHANQGSPVSTELWLKKLEVIAQYPIPILRCPEHGAGSAHDFVSAFLLLALLAGPFVSARAQSGTATSAATSDIDAIFSHYNEPGMPGCAVGVVEGGELTVLRTYGLASVENSAPITADSRFDIGSMSKQFTAMAILMLAEQGKLRLDDDVRTYVPELPGYGAPITLNHLLHHTSGLKDWDQLLTVAGWRPGDLRSADDGFWIITRQRSLNCLPGTRFSYSDTNYFLLGLIVQRITGKPLEDFLQENVFSPLGMTHTTLHVDRRVIVPQRAWPYMVQQGVPSLYLNSQETRGDGGIFTTIGDLALWERNLIAPKVAGEAVIAQMQKTQSLSDGTVNNYAPGFFVYSHRGHRMLEHNGAEYGYHADKLTFPDAALSVILLCNRRDTNVRALGERVADLFLPPNPAGAATTAMAMPSARSLDNIGDFAGPYWSAERGDGFFLTVEQGVLTRDGGFRLRPTGPATFLGADRSTYAFDRPNGGKPTQVTVTAGDPDIVGKQETVAYRRMEPPRIDVRTLRQSAGEYVSADVATVWCLYVRDTSLVIRRRGFQDQNANPVFKDAVFGPDGVVTFARRGDSVVGFTLSNDRMLFVDFEKLPKGQHPVPESASCPSGG